MPDDRLPASLYEQDFDAWATDQAAALRACGSALAGEADQTAEMLRTLDWDNLAEEIEGLAKRDRRELASRLSLIIEHLIKLEFSPAVGPRAGWIDTVQREREEIAEILVDSPSLRREVSGLVARRSDGAVELAASSLERLGEGEAAVNARRTRRGGGYSLDQIIGPGLPGEPPA